MEKKLLYVAGPVRNKSYWQRHKNILAAEEVSVALWKMGFAVHCPHKNTEFIDGDVSDEDIIAGDLVILSRCDALVLIAGWRNSEGSKIERKHAVEKDIPIFYWTEPYVEEDLASFANGSYDTADHLKIQKEWFYDEQS